MRMGQVLVGMLITMGIIGCRGPTVGEVAHQLQSEAYVRVLETPQHKMKIRLIPEALSYLIFSDIDSSRNFSKTLLDSLRTAQGKGYGLMFSLTLSPRVDSLAPTDYRNDVVYGEITGEQDYRKTMNEFLTDMTRKVWLEAGGVRHDLLTYNMTNSWGMSKSRTFSLVFETPSEMHLSRNEPIDIVVENLVPGQGRNRFHWRLASTKYDFPDG